MANVFSLCHDIEQFLQQTDENSRNQFVHWLKYRLNICPSPKKNDPLPVDITDRSMINTSQLFSCQCGHRYSLHFAVTDELYEPCSNDLVKTQNSPKGFLCIQCQIRFNTRETFLNHSSMHQQGYLFCKRCLQFYNKEVMKTHECEQRKIDELQSLEQLIPPDTMEQQQQQDSNSIDYGYDHETSASARITRFGLPKLTDSITEIIHPDGKRQFRCPLCFNSYVNRSGLNRHYITHSSQDLWKVECQYCGKRYSRKDSLKHHMKTQHTQIDTSNWLWKDKTSSSYHPSNERIFQSYQHNLLDVESVSSSSNEKEQMENDDIILVT